MFQVRIAASRSSVHFAMVRSSLFLLILLMVVVERTDSFSVRPTATTTTSQAAHHLFRCRTGASSTVFSTSERNTATATATTVTNGSSSSTKVVLPGSAFPDTNRGELSVTSCNLLAPFYHSLALEDVAGREEFAEADRRDRFPMALKLAKQTNADILLLQEIEGGVRHEAQLQALLQESVVLPDSDNSLPQVIRGYDSYLWAPLLPNKPDHEVGLCIAWRSDRHQLVAADCYKRGMVCQFSEVSQQQDDKNDDDDPSSSSSDGTFAVANVHLPARPSNILGRLVSMSRTIQKLAALDVPERESPLDGLLMVGGDWNCDQDSVTARLVTDGKVPYGNVRDRNYKANVSKAVAGRMRHGYRFLDIYGDDAFRNEYAPVTVSLHGRGPGSMDHIFYTQQAEGPKHRVVSQQDLLKVIEPIDMDSTTNKGGKATTGKRKARRDKAARMRRARRGGMIGGSSRGGRGGASNIQIDSRLATVAGYEDTTRLNIIYQGLPNVEAGFPSDHIPVGALFVPHPAFLDDDDDDDSLEDAVSGANVDDTPSIDNSSTSQSGSSGGASTSRAAPASAVSIVGGISQSVRRRREAGLQSLSVRRRHNVVLRCIAEWLERCGAQEIIRDQPLYKNYWTQDAIGLTKKSRAPDLVCRMGSSATLAVVEVTVVAPAKVESVAQQKRDKYSDLPEILPSSSTIQEAGLAVAPPMIIVLDESGTIPESTRQALNQLAAMLLPNDPETAILEAQRCYDELQSLF